jgi:hypothetical protein
MDCWACLARPAGAGAIEWRELALGVFGEPHFGVDHGPTFRFFRHAQKPCQKVPLPRATAVRLYLT